MKERKAVYKIGDKVKVVNYGHLCWVSKTEYNKYYKDTKFKTLKEKDGLLTLDSNPEYVGEEGIIVKVTITQGIPGYAITGTTKHAWFDETQLKLIKSIEA